MKIKQSLLLLFIFFSFEVFAHTEVQNTVYKNSIGLGSVIAVVISWGRNKSILYAIIHGIFSWFYVIYYYLKLRHKEINQ